MNRGGEISIPEGNSNRMEKWPGPEVNTNAYPLTKVLKAEQRLAVEVVKNYLPLPPPSFLG